MIPCCIAGVAVGSVQRAFDQACTMQIKDAEGKQTCISTSE